MNVQKTWNLTLTLIAFSTGGCRGGIDHCYELREKVLGGVLCLHLHHGLDLGMALCI